MKRRQFLVSSLAASASAFTTLSSAQTTGDKPREYYQLRKYTLVSGPQGQLLQNYLSGALLPALSRLGIGPVGVFNLDIGPDTPAVYVLMPGTALETLVTVDLHLEHDDVFMKAAEPFWSAPATAPPFVRVESSLLAAFEGWPRVVLPPAAAQHGKRVFQLRTYESPSLQAHVRKVEMFHHGEFDIFQKAGFGQVFYGDTLIGSRTPNLTYMLTFPDIAEMNDRWEKFRTDPAWKELSGNPRYNYEPIVSNISNLILSPAAFSQI